MKSKRKTLHFFLALAATAVTTHAGTIVPDLDDSAAVYSQSAANTTTLASVNLGQGVTLAARLTPSAADITSSATGAVAVIEIGGTTSGTGLWIMDGNLWFLSSSGSNTAAPTSTADFDGSNNGIGVQIGAVTAGVQSTIFASLDTTNGVLRIGQDSIVTTFELSGVTSTWNWAGNRTVSYGIADPAPSGTGFTGSRGGLVDGGANPLFNTNNGTSFTGDLALGQVFNGVSSVPEPSVPLIFGSAFIGLMTLGRRRSRNA